MSKWLAVLFITCTFCALAARPGYAGVLHRREASPSDLSALRQAAALSHTQYLRNTDEHEDDHGEEDEHGEEDDHEDGHVCIPEQNLTMRFEKVLDEHNIIFPENNGTGCPTQSQVFNVCRDILSELGMVEVNANCSEEEEGGGQGQRTDSAKAYGYGFLMVLVVSVASLLGVFVVPIKKKLPRVYLYVNALMIAMGVAALFVDAILHLIPHALGLHGHEEEEGGEHGHEGEGEDIAFLWKLSSLIAGVYVFFMLEMILHSFGGHSHGESSAHNVFDVASDSSSIDSIEKTKKPSLDVTVPHGECHEKEGSIIHPGGEGEEEGETVFQSNGDHPRRVDSKTSMDALMVSGTSEKVSSKKEKPEGVLKRLYRFLAGIKTIAWFIIIGDSVHNFADGLVLGAAISQSLALGLSTMIALIFHEIPHELGDYVILLSSGMTWYSALCFNLFAALTAIIGFFIGVAAGTSSEGANEWILAIAAGLFIYIALVDLLPQLIHSKERGWPRFGMIIMANIGFLISFIALLLIAIYEENLNNLI